MGYTIVPLLDDKGVDKSDSIMLVLNGEKGNPLMERSDSGINVRMDEEPVDPTNERLYQLYLSECSSGGVKPTIRDYLIWLREKGYTDEL